MNLLILTGVIIGDPAHLETGKGVVIDVSVPLAGPSSSVLMVWVPGTIADRHAGGLVAGQQLAVTVEVRHPARLSGQECDRGGWPLRATNLALLNEARRADGGRVT